ncbi:hypothetical protein, partial [Elizabethkingia meningoseptica]|uniref:hypothetical protein n=1 Tax=Elizabethkingia meningoseptica TaxID=238 RepID=UPI0023B1EF3D
PRNESTDSPNFLEYAVFIVYGYLFYSIKSTTLQLINSHKPGHLIPENSDYCRLSSLKYINN